MTVKTLNLRPFVPSGGDFALACNFFEDLGFQKEWESDGYAGFVCDNATFILQSYDVPEFAANYMIRVDVSNLDEWWQRVSALKLEAKYSGVKLKEPTQFPWGREVHIIDPAGVCWHIGDD